MNKKEQKKEYNKQWRLKNLERARENSRKWNAKNPEKIRKAVDKWNAKNPEKRKEITRKSIAKHPETRRKWKKNKRATDPNWRLRQNLGTRMSRVLGGTNKSVSTMRLIGCTIEELWIYLESKFEPWMTRKNYGKNGWDVDHIIPVKQWDDKCPLQFALCWDKSNLQPMEHIENIKKRDKVILGDITSPKM